MPVKSSEPIFPVTRKAAEKIGIESSSISNRNAKFPTRLRTLRESNGVSQSVLSKALGFSKSTLGLWETGCTLPDAKSLNDLANFFNVSADYLLCRTDTTSTNQSIQQICDYIGLDEDTVSLFRKLKQNTRWNEVVSHILRIAEIMEEETTNDG